MVLGYPGTQKSKWSCAGELKRQRTRASLRAWFQTVGLRKLPAWEKGAALLSWAERSHFGQAGLLMVGWDASFPASQKSEGCFETLHVNCCGML